MPADAPFSEFTEYPPLTDAQKQVLQSIGLALFGVQGIEASLRFLLNFVFPQNEQATLQELYSQDQKTSKETLGRLIRKLKENVEVTLEFERQLGSFLELRNRFVHGLFAEPEYTLGTPDGVGRVEKYISEMEFLAWHIDAVLMGYIVVFAKALGITESVQTKDSIYMRNLHKYFSPHLRIKSS